MKATNIDRRFGANLEYRLHELDGKLVLMTDSEIIRIRERALRNAEDIPNKWVYKIAKILNWSRW